MDNYHILVGDCLEQLRTLEAESVQTCITSPPYYGLRDYGVSGQIGLEDTPEAYVARLVDVFSEVRRVLRNDGTLWLNLGNCFAKKPYAPWGLKPKDLIGIPWRVAFALQADGWYLRSDIIWYKTNAMPESVRDRPTKAHEYLFLLAKGTKYYYDADAVREPHARLWNPETNNPKYFTGEAKYQQAGGPGFSRKSFNAGPNPKGRNRRTVWSIPTRPYSGAHFAAFPPALVEPCVLAGSKPGDLILDPFAGSGTTGVVALKHSRKFVGIELNPEYATLAHERIQAGK